MKLSDEVRALKARQKIMSTILSEQVSAHSALSARFFETTAELSKRILALERAFPKARQSDLFE